MQEQTIPRAPRFPWTKRIDRILPLCLALVFGFVSASPGKDIGILADRSLSVDEKNRGDAIDLIQGLLSGSIDQDIRENWILREGAGGESDPSEMELRAKELENLRRLIDGKGGTALGTGEFRLFLGEFGDLGAEKSFKEDPVDGDGGVNAAIDGWAMDIEAKDKETHFELARATAAECLGSDREFYFFVVSDGVEDLVNWPVRDYLDANKLKMLKEGKELEDGDFRDSVKKATLDSLNAKRRGGGDLLLSGKTVPGYGRAEQETLKAFEKNFSELLVGKFTLTGPALKNFFTLNPGNKVPVNVNVYSTRPRPKGAVTVRFTTPENSSPKNRHQLSNSAPRLGWKADFPQGENPDDYRFELEVLRRGDKIEESRVRVQPDGCNIFADGIFPKLDNGEYELRLAVAKGSGKAALCSAFVKVARTAPVLYFTNDFADRTESRAARKETRLGETVTWEWADGSGAAGTVQLDEPQKLTGKIAYFQSSDGDDKPAEFPITVKDGNSLTLKELFLSGSGSGSRFPPPLPIGGTYRLQIDAEWPAEVKATATAWFTLPERDFYILTGGKNKETADNPREVAKEDTIEFANELNGWKGYGYDLAVFRVEGDEEERFDGESPLTLEPNDGNPYIAVTGDFSGVLKYELSFAPEKGEHPDLEVRTAIGYVKSAGRPVLPWILGFMLVLTLGFFGWNLLRKK